MYTWWLLSFPLKVTLTKLWNIRISVHSTTFTHPIEVLRAKYIHEASYDMHTIGRKLVSSPREDALIEWGPTGLHSTRRETLGGAEHRNTAENIDKYRHTAKQIGKYRNTASKVDEIPKAQKRGVRRNLLKDFDLFARRMRLKDIFHGKENKQHPFYVESTWEPPVQQSVALETFRGEIWTGEQP